jgi:hypothetical protein
VLEEFALSALKKMRLWMRSLAHAFYFLADSKGPIRSNSRAPCYFFIDPSVQPDSIAPIQFLNLVFDLFGIHKKAQMKEPPSYSMYREVLILGRLKVFAESRLASARSRVSMSNRRLKKL